MKKKLLISIVLVILLLPSTMTIVGKPYDLPDQTFRNGPKDNNQLFLCNHFQELAERIYLKKGWVPNGIMEILFSFGR